MSFRGRDVADGGNSNKMDLGEPRRFPGGNMDDKPLGDEPDDRRFDAGRGRRPPFGRGRRPSPPGRADRPREFGGYGRDDPPSMRDRSPMRGQDDRFSDRYKKDDGAFPKRDDLGRKDIGRSFYGDDPPPRDRFMEGRSRFDGAGSFNSRFDGPADSYKPRSMNFPSAAANVAPPPRSFASEGFPKPNECEIIAVSKHQRAYAESVEARIKNMGVLVDVLFLKDEALLTQTIDDIARRGSLYAMVISPQNETHGSVTVNILHGTPQEHRNMPLEDALKLVARNFHEHIRTQKENMERERAERGPYVGGVPADKEIQFLLRMLADGRWVSMAEISDVIRYLSDRRDKMKATPGGDRILSRAPIPTVDMKLEVPYKPKDDLDVSKKEQDLQNRIINIMNQGAPSPVGGSQGLNSGMSNVNLPPPRPGQSRMSPSPNNMRSQAGPGPSGIPGLKSNTPAEEGLSSQARVEKSAARAEHSFSSATAVANPPSDSTTSQTFINFDNASVQKALDNLMQSGPNLLKNISMSGPNAPASSLAGNAPKSGAGIPGLGSSNESTGMQRGNMGPRGPGALSDIPGGGQSRGSGNMDLGPPRGPGGMSDMGGPGSQRGAGGLSDLGRPGSQRGQGNLSDLGGPGSQRGPGGMGDSHRGPGGLGDSQRGLGGMGESQRGPGGMGDLGGPGSQRGAGNMSDLGGPGGMSDIGGPGSQRGPGSDMMGMGSQRSYGGMSDMGGMNSGRGFNSGGGGMSDSAMGAPRMTDLGRMGGPPQGMGQGGLFGPNQYGKYQGGPGQQGNFGGGSYNNSSNMGNMPRQGYGGSQGMGGPRRY